MAPPPHVFLRQASNEAGQAYALFVLFLGVLLGMAALAIDVGYGYYAQRALQASVDAAATAGAQALPDAGAAESLALEYSGNAGAKNSRQNVTNVTTKVTTRCSSIAPCRPVNVVVVESTATVRTFFARVLGVNTFTVRARASACSPCGSRPLDIMLVLDRTGSMCQDHWGNNDPSCKDLRNARDGMRTFLGYFDPQTQWIGLAVFPPATRVSTRCSTPSATTYDSTSAAYTVVALSSDYKGSSGLNESSQLVSTINCQKGGGYTAYANAIEHAQAELDKNGRSDVQDVIVFFSDGAANTGPSYYPSSSPYRRRPCRQGVSSAGNAKAKGTLIYSIGYDLDALDGGANECRANSPSGPLESPSITAYQAMNMIASRADTFFNKPGPGELNTIFTTIASEIGGTMLIPEDF